MGVLGRSGPLKVNIGFAPREEGDLLVEISRDPNFVTCIWQFTNKTKLVLNPKKAYDPSLRTAKQLMRDAKPFRDEWQPESLYFKFTSKDGCTFDFSWLFESEEKAISCKS